MYVGTAPILQPDERKKLCYNLADWTKFENVVNECLIPSDDLIGRDDEEVIDKLATNLTEALKTGTQKSIPIKRRRPIAFLKIDDEIKEKIAMRNRVRKKYNTVGTLALKKELKTLNKEIKMDIKAARIQKWESTLADLKIHDGSLWKEANRLRRIPRADPIIDTGAAEINTNEEKPSFMAEELEKVFTPGKPGIRTPAVILNRGEWKEHARKETIPQITMEELENVLKLLPKGKAVGEDDLPNEVVCKMPYEARNQFLLLANKSLSSGYFPSIWKGSIVKCIPKKNGKKIKAKDLRPISLISNLGKLLERCVDKHLKQTIEEMNLLPEDQFGFRKHRSTTHQIHRVLEHITENFNNKELTIGIFLDVSKAFDRVCTMAYYTN
jgi:hypothetical protein